MVSLNTSLQPSGAGANFSVDKLETLMAMELELTDEDLKRILANLLSAQNHDHFTQSCIIVAFAILMVFGAIGNSLVCAAVARNPKMRTPRNLFVVNLAISDLTLCVFTQLFNLLKVLTNEWKWGSSMCKFLPMFAGTNVFVSTISITAIALDRFQVIVYPARHTLSGTHRGSPGSGRGVIVGGRLNPLIYLLVIWLVAMLAACPLAVFNGTVKNEPIENIVIGEMCIEKTDMALLMKIFSVFSLLVQYLLPIVIVSVAHARISCKLKQRLALRQSSTQHLPQQPPHEELENKQHHISYQRSEQNDTKYQNMDKNRVEEFVAVKKSETNQRTSLSDGVMLPNELNYEQKTSSYHGAVKELDQKPSQRISSTSTQSLNQTICLREDRSKGLEQHQACSVPGSAHIDLDEQVPTVGGQHGVVDAKERVNPSRSQNENVCEPIKEGGGGGSKRGGSGRSVKEEDAIPSRRPLSTTAQFYENKRRREDERKRRTNRLLVLIAVVFAASWMPLNIANVMADFNFPLVQAFDAKIGNLLFPICHLVVLCSACVNPVLYGWLNENFRSEFRRILVSAIKRIIAFRKVAVCRRCCSCCESFCCSCCGQDQCRCCGCCETLLVTAAGDSPLSMTVELSYKTSLRK